MPGILPSDPMREMTVIQTEKLSKRYGTTVALDGLDLEVNDEEVRHVIKNAHEQVMKLMSSNRDELDALASSVTGSPSCAITSTS